MQFIYPWQPSPYRLCRSGQFSMAQKETCGQVTLFTEALSSLQSKWLYRYCSSSSKHKLWRSEPPAPDCRIQDCFRAVLSDWHSTQLSLFCLNMNQWQQALKQVPLQCQSEKEKRTTTSP